MTHETTSLVRARSIRNQWRDYASFLRRPTVPDGIGRYAEGLGASLRMLGLDILLMGLLLSLVGFAMLAGIELPDNALNDLVLTPAVIFAIVVVAPVMEEIGFRGWLSGRPAHVVSLLIIGGGALSFAFLSGEDEPGPLVGLVLIGTLLAAIAALILLWKRPPPRWFQRFFPLFFWLSSLGFALIHLFNYTEGTLLFLLPLVLPQFVLGTICAYLRVHYGLWTAILLHALHNGLLIGITLLAMDAQG